LFRPKPKRAAYCTRCSAIVQIPSPDGLEPVRFHASDAVTEA
jgi:hypothetical protein